MSEPTLGGAHLAVVAGFAGAAEALCRTLEAEGAHVTPCVLASDDLRSLSTGSFDAALLLTEDRPAAFAPLVAALGADPRTCDLPVVALVDARLGAAELAPLAGAAFVPHDPEGRAVVAVLGRVLPRARAAHDAVASFHDTQDRIRKVLRRLTTVHEDTGRFAHDTLAMVGIVVGYAANLRDEVPGPLAPGQVTHVARILEAATDLSEMIERHQAVVRTASLVSADEEPISVRRSAERRGLHDLTRLVAATCAMLQQAAAEREVTLAFDAGDPIEVWCDAMQVKQVMTNLIANALKFSPARARIDVQVRLDHGTGERAGGEASAARSGVVLTVADAGPGVPEEERERVFDRGFRLERDRAKPGSGVGLSVVKHIVDAHGGQVHVERSDALGGACFVVTLPVDRRARRRALRRGAS